MSRFTLPCTNGVNHLPKPSGPFSVGFVDIFTPPRNGSLPGLLFRLYYPSSTPIAQVDENQTRWGRWFPLPQYANEYLRYKFSSLGLMVPVLGRLFTWLSGNPLVPAAQGARILKDGNRWPVVVFSHGLAACRTSYSFLCTDLASKGYFVAALEHGDGSACLRTLKTSKDAQIEFKYQELLEAGTPEYEIRNKQVKQRASEAGDALNMLEQMNQGSFNNTWVQNMTETELDDFQRDVKDSMNTDMVVIGGHSFGGATTTLCLATDPRFKVGVALDSWMFPIREENLNYTSPGNLLFINCEKFQGTKNLQTMKTYEGSLDNEVKSNVVTVLKATHYAPTDIPIIMEGSKANSLYKMIGGGGEAADGLSNWDNVQLFSGLFHSWVQKCLGFENSFAKMVAEQEANLTYGIEIKQE